METSFRAAATSDADTILAMMRELYAHDPTPLDEPAARAALSRLLAGDPFGIVHLILLDDYPAGYVVLTFGFSLEFGGRDAFVDEIFVREEFRGRGAGAGALRFAEEVCRVRGVRALHLEVEHANSGAQALYRRLGFRDRGYYLMTRRL